MENMVVKSSDIEFVKDDVNSIVKELNDLNDEIKSKFKAVSVTGLYSEGLNNISLYISNLIDRYNASIRVLNKFEDDISTTEDYFSYKFKDVYVPDVDGTTNSSVKRDGLDDNNPMSEIIRKKQAMINKMVDNFNTDNLKESSFEDNYNGSKKQIGI